MQIHDVLSASLSSKTRKRKGRGPGSGKGKTCGRGREGATSRSGWSMKPTYEGGQMTLFRRLPKRGFTNGPFKEVFTVVNIEQLAAFPAGTKVGRKELQEKGMLRGRKGMPLKILGEGELSVGLTVVADKFSKSALDKISKAGGQAEWANGAPKKPTPNFRKIERDKKMAEKLIELKAAKDSASKSEKGKSSKS